MAVKLLPCGLVTELNHMTVLHNLLTSSNICVCFLQCSCCLVRAHASVSLLMTLKRLFFSYIGLKHIRCTQDGKKKECCTPAPSTPTLMLKFSMQLRHNCLVLSCCLKCHKKLRTDNLTGVTAFLGANTSYHSSRHKSSISSQSSENVKNLEHMRCSHFSIKVLQRFCKGLFIVSYSFLNRHDCKHASLNLR